MDKIYEDIKDILSRELAIIKRNGEYQVIQKNYFEIKKYFDLKIRNQPDKMIPYDLEEFFKMIKRDRKGSIQLKRALADFNRTKEFIIKLVDDRISDEWKLENIVTSDGGIPGMQKTGPTILLHFYNPDKFSVWNTVIKGKLDERVYFQNMSYSKTSPTYLPWNDLVNKLAKDLEINTWTVEDPIYKM